MQLACNLRFLSALTLAASVASVLPSTHASADPVADFYAGKQVTFVIGYTVGAAYDAHGRVVARHLGKHIPGKPSVIVQNMPGAGSLVSANHLYNVAPQDGTAIGMFSRGNAVYPLLEGAAQFDALKFNWIGSPAKEVSVVISWHTTPFKTVEDIRKGEMIVGATGAGADTVVLPYVLNATIGSKMRPVTGYPGNAEALLALERGEVQGNAGTSLGTLRAAHPDWIRDKKINVLVQLALDPHPREFKGVPLALDFAQSPLDKQVLELILSRQSMAYPIVAPPNVPSERVKALREAFVATMKDAAFLADAEKATIEVDPLTGDRIAALVQRVYAAPKEVVERARAAIAAGSKK